MDTKFQELNSKILFVTTCLEQNRQNIFRNIEEEDKDNIYNLFNQKRMSLVNESICIKTGINIEKGILLNSKINSMENEYVIKSSKLKEKFDKLNDEINKLTEIMNFNFETDCSYQEQIITDANNIKKNMNTIYEEQNSKLAQEINGQEEYLINCIKTVTNVNSSEDLMNQRDILDLGKYYDEISCDFGNKICLYGENIENDRKERAREICAKFENEDLLLEQHSKKIDSFFDEVTDKLGRIVNNIVPRFVNIEENKRTDFKNSINDMLNETIQGMEK